MARRKRKNSLSRSLSRVVKEAADTLKSALGLVPVLGTALGAFGTTRKAVRTVRATRRAGRTLKSKMGRHPRRTRRSRRR